MTQLISPCGVRAYPAGREELLRCTPAGAPQRLPYRFGPFTLLPSEHSLWRDGKPLPLARKDFELLAVALCARCPDRGANPCTLHLEPISEPCTLHPAP